MTSRLVLSVILLALAAAPAAVAIQPGEMLANPVQEERARAIDKELRCLVCQNENIDDSNADLAHDLRVLVRKRVMAGDSNEQVKQYIVARYGNYVLLKPPFDSETYLLWFAPALLLLGALGVAFAFYRNGANTRPEPLSPEDAARVAALIDDAGAGEKRA
jgi:cytochrome c-type biogenesis protein CcmH